MTSKKDREELINIAKEWRQEMTFREKLINIVKDLEEYHYFILSLFEKTDKKDLYLKLFIDGWTVQIENYKNDVQNCNLNEKRFIDLSSIFKETKDLLLEVESILNKRLVNMANVSLTTH